VSAAGAPHPNGCLPPGVSFEDAEKIAQGVQNAIAALTARFGANHILPLQWEFIDFFAELPDIAWLALRQAMVAARVPIRDIDKRVAAQRAKLARAAAKDPRREACFSIAVALKAQGATLAAVREALLGNVDPDVANWARDNDEDALRRLYNSASPQKLLSVSDFVAHMSTKKFIYTATGDLWPAASVDARVPPCEVVDRTGNPIFKSTGKPLHQPASVWLSSHAPVEQMTFAPGEPQIIHGKLMLESGWILHEGAAAFNIYLPPPPLPPSADPAKAGRWLDHVRLLYPEEGGHIIKYFAHCAQRPGEKINHGVVLGGEQGIGKDTLLAPLRYAVGPWNVQEVSPLMMMGRFNGFNRCVVLVISEAKDMGETNRYQFYEHMKPYLAAPPDALRTDEKNRPEYYVLNVLRGIMTTNHKTGGIYLPADDRRHYVAWSIVKAASFPEGHWIEFWKWYEGGGFGHVAAYLRTLDISDFDPKAPPPRTSAFWEIVDANRSTEDSELADLLDRLKRPPGVTLDILIKTAEGAMLFPAAEWLRDRKNRRVVPIRLEKCGYGFVRNSDADDGLFVIEGRRQVVYARSDLLPREQFAAARTLARGRP
jgi:Family of unknown function (DUF5906)